MKNRSSVWSVLVVIGVFAGCTGGDVGDRIPPASGAIDTVPFTTSSPRNAHSGGADSATATTPPAVDSAPVVTHTATMKTTLGDVSIELYGNDAPRTVANFVGLARKKFYDGLAFHRVALGFVIQAGDPLTRDTNRRAEWGSGGESIYGAPFEDEVDPAAPSRRRGYVAGVLAMANSGRNTNLSQFFIITSTPGAAHLAQYNSYSIFGLVTGGMEVVKRIEATGGEGENPHIPARIVSVVVKAIAPASTGR